MGKSLIQILDNIRTINDFNIHKELGLAINFVFQDSIDIMTIYQECFYVKCLQDFIEKLHNYVERITTTNRLWDNPEQIVSAVLNAQYVDGKSIELIFEADSLNRHMYYITVCADLVLKEVD